MNITRNIFGGLSLWLSLAGLEAQPLKFELIDQYKIVVRGSIGQLEGLRLMIDTGAIPSMVDRRVAKKLALHVEEAEYVAFGKKARVQTTVLPNIRLGPLHADAVAAGVGDLSFLNGVDAIVGLDLLARSSFSIDYGERRLEFGPVLAREPGVRLEATPPFLTVQLAVAGQSFRFLVDTGSSRLILFENRVLNRLPFLSVHGELVLNHLSGSSRLQRVFLPPIDADGSTIQHVEGFMSDQSVDGYPAGIDGVLGLRVLASKRADFDFERNRLAFNH
jgi:predicted aspartyl protease